MRTGVRKSGEEDRGGVIYSIFLYQYYYIPVFGTQEVNFLHFKKCTFYMSNAQNDMGSSKKIILNIKNNIHFNDNTKEKIYDQYQ